MKFPAYYIEKTNNISQVFGNPQLGWYQSLSSEISLDPLSCSAGLAVKVLYENLYIEEGGEASPSPMLGSPMVR